MTFVVCRWLFVDWRLSLRVACRGVSCSLSLFVVRWLFAVCSFGLFVCSLFVVVCGSSWFVVRWSLRVVCCWVLKFVVVRCRGSLCVAGWYCALSFAVVCD